MDNLLFELHRLLDNYLKWLLRVITGQSEVQRIADRVRLKSNNDMKSFLSSVGENVDDPSNIAVCEFIQAIRNTPSLAPVAIQLGLTVKKPETQNLWDPRLEHVVSKPEHVMNLETRLADLCQAFKSSHQMEDIAVQAANEICSSQGIDPKNDELMKQLRYLTARALAVGFTIQVCRKLQMTPYSSENELHEALLEDVWKSCMGERERLGGRISKSWGDIGFQGKDPATDFRGGGEMSLLQLAAFVKSCPELTQRFLKEPTAEIARYPFACCSIQVTGSVVEFLKAGDLDMLLVRTPSSLHMRLLNGLHMELWQMFHNEYINSKPQTVMDFPPSYKKAMLHMEQDLKRNGYLSTHVQDSQATDLSEIIRGKAPVVLKPIAGSPETSMDTQSANLSTSTAVYSQKLRKRR